jgi:hypothetical protein
MAPHLLVQVFIHISTLKILPSPYSKGPLKRTYIQRKLVATPIIFHRTKRRHSTTVHELSPQNKILIITVNRPPCWYLWFSAKVISLKVVHIPSIYQNTQFHGSALTGASLVSTSEVVTSAILEWLKLWH